VGTSGGVDKALAQAAWSSGGGSVGVRECCDGVARTRGLRFTGGPQRGGKEGSIGRTGRTVPENWRAWAAGLWGVSGGWVVVLAVSSTCLLPLFCVLACFGLPGKRSRPLSWRRESSAWGSHNQPHPPEHTLELWTWEGVWKEELRSLHHSSFLLSRLLIPLHCHFPFPSPQAARYTRHIEAHRPDTSRPIDPAPSLLIAQHGPSPSSTSPS
jgi:hypothetical protein